MARYVVVSSPSVTTVRQFRVVARTSSRRSNHAFVSFVRP
jgi:hypothetical protein